MISFMLLLLMCDPTGSACYVVPSPVVFQDEEGCKRTGDINVKESALHPSGLIVKTTACVYRAA